MYTHMASYCLEGKIYLREVVEVVRVLCVLGQGESQPWALQACWELALGLVSLTGAHNHCLFLRGGCRCCVLVVSKDG